MSLLEPHDAQAPPADAILTPEQVHGCQERLTTLLQRNLPRFCRVEQRTHAALFVRGLLSGLMRKTCEPIAVGPASTASRSRISSTPAARDDEAAMAEPRGHGREVLALEVDAMTARVRTKDQRRVGPEERLVVMRTVEAAREQDRLYGTLAA